MPGGAARLRRRSGEWAFQIRRRHVSWRGPHAYRTTVETMRNARYLSLAMGSFNVVMARSLWPDRYGLARFRLNRPSRMGSITQSYRPISRTSWASALRAASFFIARGEDMSCCSLLNG